MRPSRVPSLGLPDNAQHVLQADEYEAAHLIAGGLVVTSNEMSLSCRFCARVAYLSSAGAADLRKRRMRRRHP
jgi:hypothetical protein